MTILTNETEVAKIREAGCVMRKIFGYLKTGIREGISTAEIDRQVEEIIRENKAEPAFKGYRGYPASICASVNEVVVHGIPSPGIILKKGDIITIDVGVKKNGYYVDAAKTFEVETVEFHARRLIEFTRKSLDEGIKKAIAGNRVSDISMAIQRMAEQGGFKEVRSFVGHGIGRSLHESPEVPNWGTKGEGPVLREGMVLAIEPMFNSGKREVRVLKDGWTAVTVDGKLSAHFEETVIVGCDKAEIIT